MAVAPASKAGGGRPGTYSSSGGATTKSAAISAGTD